MKLLLLVTVVIGSLYAAEDATTPTTPKADCYLCAPTVPCGGKIEGDFTSGDVNILLQKKMEDNDYFIVRGLVNSDAKEIYFDIYKDMYVGTAQIGGEQPTLLQFQHFYDTNLTFSRSGLGGGKEAWDSFRPAILPNSILQKKPWALLFKLHQNSTGMETGDENGFFANHIPWNGTATTMSFNIRGDWKTTQIEYKCGGV